MNTTRIIFWCGRALEPWAPPTLETTGIGGSETAVVHIARRFAKAGWRVDVFNSADRFEGVYDDVGYWDLNRLRHDERCDVFVSWRQPEAHAIPVDARVKLIWCHDLNNGPGAADHLAKYDRVLGVSAWHAAYLREVYGLSEGSVDFVPNGIDLGRFADRPKKVPMRCIYASSPDRGLQRLLAIWPQILKAQPDAELQIAYGWDNIDKMIAGGRGDLAAFKAEIEGMLARLPNVAWLGRLNQRELARVDGEAAFWLYPTTFLEVSCITAMEMMAAGAIPITSAVGALKETIGSPAEGDTGGIVVAGNPFGNAWKAFYGQVVTGTMTDIGVRMSAEQAARRRAERYSWEASFARWQSIVEATLRPETLSPVEDRGVPETILSEMAAG